MEATSVMLHDQGLPKFLWGDDANTIVYVQNRRPHQAQDSKQPKKFSLAYRIYVPGQRDVEISHDVTFNENTTLGKARDIPIPRKDNNDYVAEKQDEPPTDELMPDPPPSDPSSSRKRPLWLKDSLEYAERHIAPRGTFCESKKSNRYQGYLVSTSTIIQSKPCTFEKAVKYQVWKDAMNEEYESITKNYVWDVVPRPKDKSIVNSKWLYKIKHGADGSAEKYKARFVARVFSQKEGVDYDEIFALVARYTTI
eukprot:PITA_19242